MDESQCISGNIIMPLIAHVAVLNFADIHPLVGSFARTASNLPIIYFCFRKIVVYRQKRICQDISIDYIL